MHVSQLKGDPRVRFEHSQGRRLQAKNRLEAMAIRLGWRPLLLGLNCDMVLVLSSPPEDRSRRAFAELWALPLV